MENKDKEKLLKKIDELVEIIKNSNEYKRFCELKIMAKDDNITSLINNIKKVQQNIIKKEHDGKDTLLLEEELLNLKKELDTFPIYKEYTYLQEDLNNDFQNIKAIIENSINY